MPDRSFWLYPDRWQRDHPSSAEKAHRRARPSRSVDVSDIVAMRKHILVDRTTCNARKMIAADTNEDDSIDVADIVAMRKVILAKSDTSRPMTRAMPNRSGVSWMPKW